MLSRWFKKRCSPSTYRVFLTSWDLFRYSGRRNSAVVLVSILVGCMLTMLTGLAVNVDANWSKSAIRRAGSAAKLLVEHTSERQLERLRSQDQVETVGLLYSAGQSQGFSLCYADTPCWEKILSPAIGDMEGEYPRKEKEILVSRAYLAQTGQGDAVCGDTVDLATLGSFRISGIFTDYAQEAGINNLYVSWDFIEKQHKAKKSNVTVMLSSKMVDYYLDWIIVDECGIDEEQITYVGHQPVGRDRTIIVLKWILFFVFLCGGLSVYHIFYAAVCADQRDYGLLSVIGMGRDQMFLCMRFQGIFFAIPGILLGELAGTGGQAVLVPWFMTRFLAADEQVASFLVTEVHFYPMIPLLASLLIVAMLVASFRVVAWKICRQSPMERLRGISGKSGTIKILRGRRSTAFSEKDRVRYRISNSQTRLRTLAWQNQKGCWKKNLLTSVCFLVSSNFFLLVHSLSSFPGFSVSDGSFLAQKLSCIRVLGDFIGAVVFGVAVIGLYSIAFMQMRERETEFSILRSIGMTNRQLLRMLVWEGTIQYLQFAVVFVLVELPVWLALSVCFSLEFPWAVGSGILLLTFPVYLAGFAVWREKGR